MLHSERKETILPSSGSDLMRPVHLFYRPILVQKLPSIYIHRPSWYKTAVHVLYGVKLTMVLTLFADSERGGGGAALKAERDHPPLLCIRYYETCPSILPSSFGTKAAVHLYSPPFLVQNCCPSIVLTAALTPLADPERGGGGAPLRAERDNPPLLRLRSGPRILRGSSSLPLAFSVYYRSLLQIFSVYYTHFQFTTQSCCISHFLDTTKSCVFKQLFTTGLQIYYRRPRIEGP